MARDLDVPTAVQILKEADYVDAWPAVHGTAEGFTGMWSRSGCGEPEGYLWKRIDRRRRVAAGASEKALGEIYERRNRIAHQGDRSGRGRAAISIDEVEADLQCIAEIADALDKETAP